MFFFFFFNDTATTEIYTVGNTLSLHDALPISHTPDVVDPCGRFGRRGHPDLEQQVRRILDVVLDASRDPVVHQAKIDGPVVLVGALPLEVRVGIAQQRNTGLRCVSPRVRSARARRQEAEGRIGRYAGVARATPADTHPEVRKRAVAQEFLLTEVPRSRQPREDAPLVSGGEAGRAVVAQDTRQEEAILVAVVRPGEEGNETPVLRP